MNTYEVEIGGNFDRVTVRADNCGEAEQKALKYGRKRKFPAADNYVSKIETVMRDRDIDIP